jgi:hypothetical protein
MLSHVPRHYPGNKDRELLTNDRPVVVGKRMEKTTHFCRCLGWFDVGRLHLAYHYWDHKFTTLFFWMIQIFLITNHYQAA